MTERSKDESLGDYHNNSKGKFTIPWEKNDEDYKRDRKILN